MDGLMLFLVVVILTTAVVVYRLAADLPEQVHNPAEYRGLGPAVRVALVVLVVSWVVLMLVR